MKNLLSIIIFLFIIIACSSSKTNNSGMVSSESLKTSNDTIRIANDTLEYEVIIIDANFSTWLHSNAYPRNFHSLTYLENKNLMYINEWNYRVLQPQRYNSNLYERRIDYNSNIRYGYEVNYLIYNYMIYFQNTFKQSLNGYVPMR